MTRIDPTSTLGVFVAERPALAAVFERLRMDYCCGGAVPLAEACDKHGFDLDAVQAALDHSDAESGQGAGPEDQDWRQASIRELCAHIVGVHHDGLRESLPRIERLLATVVRVHGAGRPELLDLHQAFGEL